MATLESAYFLCAKLRYKYRYYTCLGFLDNQAWYVHAYMQVYWFRFEDIAKVMDQKLK